MLTSLILPPLALWATWLLWIGLLTGVGLLVRSTLVHTRELTGEALFASFWLGMAAVTVSLLLLHFVAPITTVTTVAVVLLGLTGLALHVNPLLRGLSRTGRIRVYGALAGSALIGIWSGLHGLQAVAAFDTHMYLIPAVEWIGSFHLPPGLANLNDRYGFNTGTLPLAAMIEAGPWVDGSTYIVNGVFVTVLLFRIASSVSGWPGVCREDRARRFLDLVLLTPVLAMIASPNQFRSLEADIPATIAILSALSLMIGRLFSEEDARPDSLIAAGCALALAAMFKLSAAAVAVPLWLVLLVLCARAPGQQRRLLATLMTTSAALALVWMARGVVLSGYPLYPMHVVSFPVDWRVPREQVDASAAWVLYFAKTHYAPSQYNNARLALICGSVEWIRPWFRMLLTSSYWWQVVLPITGAIGLGGLGVLRRTTWRMAGSLATIVTALIVGGTIWFALAPRPDLGVPIAWSLLGVTAAWHGAAPITSGRWRHVATFLPLLAGLGLAALPLAGFMAHDYRAAREQPVYHAIRGMVPRPEAGSWLVPTRWEFPVLPYWTDNHLELLRPGFHRCSRASFPCSSHPAKNLRLRVKGDLTSGFAVDGDWVAERYPNPVSDFLNVWRFARYNGVCADGLRAERDRPKLKARQQTE